MKLEFSNLKLKVQLKCSNIRIWVVIDVFLKLNKIFETFAKFLYEVRIFELGELVIIV